MGNGGGRGVRLKQLGGGPGHAGAFYEAAPPGPRAARNGPKGGGVGSLGGRAGRAAGYAHVACWVPWQGPANPQASSLGRGHRAHSINRAPMAAQYEPRGCIFELFHSIEAIVASAQIKSR